MFKNSNVIERKLYRNLIVIFCVIIIIFSIDYVLIKIQERTPIKNPIFVINVDSAKSRLEAMKRKLGDAQFTKLAITPSDLKLTFVDSQDRKRTISNLTMSPDIIYDNKDWTPPIKVHCGKDDSFIWTSSRKISPGEFGCFCSHRAIWKKIVEQQLDNVLVFEDDVVFSRFFKLILFALNTKYLPYKFDYIDLRRKKGKIFNVLLNSDIAVRWGAESYMVSLQGAKKLLSFSNEADREIDHVIGNFILDHKSTFGMRYAISKGQEYGRQKVNNTTIR
ncbi:MAG: glycosyltransferase family 25 protein [Rickettsiales bacterium]|nr:glycosyltransferase family 25 protein [Rickettsiales bacterium]